MTAEEESLVQLAVERAAKWCTITEQFRIQRGERTADYVLTREWKRASRVMREALAKSGNPVAANSAVQQYAAVYNALAIVRRDAGKSITPPVVPVTQDKTLTEQEHDAEFGGPELRAAEQFEHEKPVDGVGMWPL